MSLALDVSTPQASDVAFHSGSGHQPIDPRPPANGVKRSRDQFETRGGTAQPSGATTTARLTSTEAARSLAELLDVPSPSPLAMIATVSHALGAGVSVPSLHQVASSLIFKPSLAPASTTSASTSFDSSDHSHSLPFESSQYALQLLLPSHSSTQLSSSIGVLASGPLSSFSLSPMGPTFAPPSDIPAPLSLSDSASALAESHSSLDQLPSSSSDDSVRLRPLEIDDKANKQDDESSSVERSDDSDSSATAAPRKRKKAKTTKKPSSKSKTNKKEKISDKESLTPRSYRALKLQKHNESEIRRRTKINKSYRILAQMISSREPPKAKPKIMSLTIDRIRSLERRLSRYALPYTYVLLQSRLMW
jgi:hypothetical protein